MSALSQILEHKIVAILRGASPDDIVRIADALYEGGVRLMEVTMNSEEPLRAIEQLVSNMGEKMVIGAGTVLDSKMLKDAVDAGAQFILSPVMDIEVIHAARDLGVVSIPGAYTATEVFTAFKNGADIIKVFPAGSPAYLKDLRGPLPQIPMMPTGGVTLENIADFHKVGAVGFGIGGALVDTKEKVTDEYLSKLSARAAAFVAAVHHTI